MITNILVGVTILISYLVWEKGFGLITKWSHYPYREVRFKEWGRLVSSGFLHGSWNHLLINMFVLYQFGQYVESYFVYRFDKMEGSIIFLSLYLSSVIVSNIGTLFKHRNNQSFTSVGASGATSSMVMIYTLFQPWQMFLFPPVPAVLFAILYIGYSTWASKNRNDHIDHQAHLWGTCYGFLFMMVIDPPVIALFYDQLTHIPWLN